jgi:Uri superfamily endonuclease|tara:strand:- start:101 stop:526 length:426 start_codon:yes stop_codon:yes gene_type:complete
MSTKNGKKRVKLNQTVYNMRSGLMTFKRRLDIPMWHIDHLNKSIEAFEEIVDELKRIRNSNTLRNSDKCMYAQTTLTMMAKRFYYMLPKDPRSRGSEHLEYVSGFGLVDKSGHADLLAREDLDEQVKYEPGRWSGPSPTQG